MSSVSDDMLLQKLKRFSEINQKFRRAFDFVSKEKSTSETKKCEYLLQYLAHEILIVPEYFDVMLECFSEEFPKLLHMATSDKECGRSESRHVFVCILLAKVLRARKDLHMYALKYFNEHPSIFEFDQGGAVKRRKSNDASYTDLDIVEATYFILKSNPDFYRNKWKWLIFIKNYFAHDDPRIRWLSCHILSILFGFYEHQLHRLLNKTVRPDDADKFLCTFDRCSTLIDQRGVDSPDDHLASVIVRRSPSDDSVVCVSGVYLSVLPDGPGFKLPLVEVPSTYNNLRKIALGLTANRAICLRGPVGSGKTSLVEFLAGKTGRRLGESFVKVQLGDQTDSKMLLGTYRCTDVPGEFVWQAGVLTQAVLEGSWLLLEDIDSASMDIASVISSLLENKTLTVPGYRDAITVAPTFQLFVTQRLVTTISGHHKRHSNAMSLLEKYLLHINVDPLSPEELKVILNTWYEQFRTVSDRMIDVFLLFNSYETKPSGRLISTRDFFKWCSRAIIDFNVSSQESALKVLQDAIDVFCCSYSSADEALELAKKISTHLGIINQKAEYFFKTYKPTMRLTTDELIAGRIVLSRTDKTLTGHSNYSFTRPSSVLIERIMCCVRLKEPVLLVGETGTGKTSCVQYLANVIGQRLVVINMNQQSDSADLLGGFKPVDLKFVIGPVRREFESVFCDYFKVEPNRKYLGNVALCFNNERWSDLVKLMTKSCRAALDRLSRPEGRAKDQEFLSRWRKVSEKLHKLDLQVKHKSSLAFAFIEGSLVKAVENGHWVLLDEINLANAETLECLSGLLEGTRGSLCLLERGDKRPVRRHPDFTLFACMNPSTDVGKKDLPAGLRNRFTEFFVDELNEKTDLLLLVNNYLEAMSLKQKDLEGIVDFYLRVRRETVNSLSDGSGHRPHFSLRSLCRALTVASKNPCGTFKRGLYEAFCLSFLTQLDSRSYQIVEGLIARYTIGDQKSVKAVLKQPIPKPSGLEGKFLQFEGYWVEKGGLEPEVPEEYVLTESVRKNLKDLTRVVSIGRLPVLLQGDTSVGKTSLITYLARSSGNRCVRINNHEHTDLQEYIGSYIADSDGKLIFREGLLVEAMRKGHWIILDELNLAPTDVLEALNRVLDDNRELFIPETQQTVKANRNFMLFATQNPPGAYGGRKMLSRAFRNRFVELHFNEIPAKELEFILHRRCKMAPSYSKKMIAVMTELQVRRKGSTAFAGKHGFMTLRDLFRWGERYRLAEDKTELYDWDQHLADEGYLVLAGRVRKGEERKEIVEVLEKHLKRKVEPERLFTLSPSTSVVTRHILEKIEANKHKDSSIVWTYSMRQLAVLVSKAIDFNEPILLVGETGGGKTTVCKLIAEFNNQRLIGVNCHMHTESGDFIGGLRPVRDHSSEETATKLFEWVNGPLIEAMVQGQVFLADEISLADDSVLERLNSLLEPERTLLLAEKGIDLDNSNNSETIVAHPGFVFIGTMNPGGDFGKKELSPALRNRFTEIWCEPCTDRADLIDIIERNLKDGITLGDMSGIGKSIVDFVEWFGRDEIGKRITVSIRDLLTWTNFINACAHEIGAAQAYIHGADLTFLDSLGSGVTSTENSKSLNDFKEHCREFLHKQASISSIASSSKELKVEIVDDKFGIHPFYIKSESRGDVTDFSFNAPTTLRNTAIILRAMQLDKAILLEGSPGVGKTGLVTALAKVTGHKLYRVNLSDQTDVSDLFGADLPVEGGKGGQFSWRDGPLLQALKDGDWILLDELNLASQSVLEGLNACLDHRGEIFVPELGKTFYVKPGTKFFACQNPLKQGGARRGLPRSFLNRFTQVYIQPLAGSDMSYILTGRFKTIPPETIGKMIEFNSRIASGLDSYEFGHKGAPWECNLRDLTRWCESTLLSHRPESTVGLIYADRMRTPEDKDIVLETFAEVFHTETSRVNPLVYFSRDEVYTGDARIVRARRGVNEAVLRTDKPCLVLRSQAEALRSLSWCVNMNWMAIVVGSSGTGKSSVVKTLANLSGKTLRTLPVTSAMDTSDLLGGFEQSDYGRHLDEIAREAERSCLEVLQETLVRTGKGEGEVLELLERWQAYVGLRDIQTQTMDEELRLFLEKSAKLQAILNCLERHKDQNLDELLDKLGKLSRAAKADGSLNAGGKFEWVDSILVKCLRDGSWLLIDNVNLCSSAVLDRLNSLLEPNGVLTLSERGVGADGKTIEIRPHPDFRLFLTMDPKNGEVSRAMRNRGVEICLASPRHTLNDLDLTSLVRLEGLADPSHIALLLKTHDFIASIVHGEAPRVNELLQLASSVSQQLKHGSELREAIRSCAAEVYCKTRSLGEFSCADPANVISCEVSGFVAEARQVGFNERVTINVSNLNSSSMLEKLSQQFCSYEEDSIYSLLLFYSMSSKEELPLRQLFLKQSVQNKDLSSLIDALHEVAKSSTFGDVAFPFDRNWFPDLPYNSTKVEDTSRYNLGLYLEVLKFTERMEYSERKIQDVKNKQLTLFDYMLSKQRKKLQDNFNDVIVDTYLRFEREYDQYLKVILDGTTALNNDNFITTLYLVMWRFIFRKSTLRNIRSVGPEEKSDLILHLQVHFRWFLKYSIEGVGEVTNIPPGEELGEVLNQIRLRLDKQFSRLQELGKTYQKLVERPKPYLTSQQLAAAETYDEISKSYDLYTNSCDVQRILDSFTREKNLRPLLIEIKSRLHDSYDLSDQITALKTIHESLTNRSDDIGVVRSDFKLLQVSDALLRLRVQTDGDFSRSDEVSLPLDMATSCAFEYNKAFYLYLLKSPSVKGSSLFSPKMAYLITGALGEGKIGLGEVREEERRREWLNLAAWANMLQLSEEQYDFLNNELERIKSTYSAFLQQLTNVLFDSHTQEATFEALLQKLKTYEVDPDLKHLTKHLEDCDINIKKLSSKETPGKFDETLQLIAELYMKINLIKAVFNSRLPLIDPLVKKSLKRKHIGDISGIFQRIKRCYEVQNMLFSDTQETKHIYCERIEDKLRELKEKEDKLGKYVAVRSKDVPYNSVITHVDHAFTTILSPPTVTKTISNLRYLIVNISSACAKRTRIDLDHFTAKLNHYESTALSYENLLHDWSKYRTSYPDMIEPLLSNVAEFLYGLRLQVALLKMKVIHYKYVKLGVELRDDLSKVMKFPVLGREMGEYEGYVEWFGGLEGFVAEALREEEDEGVKSEAIQKLWKCGLYECFNLCVIDASNNSHRLDRTLFDTFVVFVDKFITSWNRQQKEKEQKETEAESLYKMKTKCEEKSDDELAQDEIKALFTNFHDKDFPDLQPEPIQDAEPTVETDNFSWNDLKEAISLHQILVRNYVRTEWLNPETDKGVGHDFIRPLVTRFEVFGRILEKDVDGLDYRMDDRIMGSLVTMLGVARKYGDMTDLTDLPSSPSRSSKKSSDFYRDSNVAEVKTCYHILEELRLRVEEYLQEWPEQPTLKLILSVIDRIYSFDVKSPLARFLTGLEILLTNCHEWEQVAHSKISLSHFYKSLIDQIVSWRKLELSMWKDLLNRTYERMNDSLPKWWIYLYNIMRQFIFEKLFDKRELLSTLQNFITKSNLAEFHGRLDLLYVFHCHSSYLERSKESEEFTNILWNLHSYFQQFDSTVSNKIKDLKSPIEKQLKDYVKIVRWKDVSYWSVKQTVDKSHKTLHKYVKEFQNVLQQPVTPYLTNTHTKLADDNVGIWDRPQRQNPKTYHYTLEAESYLTKQSTIKKFLSAEEKAEEGLLGRIETYFMKSRTLCRETISSTEYPELIQNLDGFVGDVIETSSHLQNLEVDTTLSKAKQKSQAKNILQQKHRALADLFKTLRRIGLSFKGGVVQGRLKDNCQDFLIKPVDLSVNFNQYSHNSREEKILTIWDSCELYYVRSLMRSDVLDGALLNPAKDLGLQNIERCKGFGNDLLLLAQKLKTSLITSTRSYYYLKHCIKQLTESCEGKEFLHQDLVKRIKALLRKVSITLNQCKIILNTCPEQGFETIEVPVLNSKVPDRICYKNDDLWATSMDLINSTLSAANKLNGYVVKCEGMICATEYVLIAPTFIPVGDKELIKNDLQEVLKGVVSLREVVGNGTMVESLSWLEEEIDSTMSKFHEEIFTDNEVIGDDTFKRKLERLMETILLTIQNIYKKYSKSEKEIVSSGDKLKDDHLKYLLVENLTSDIELLELPKVLKRTHKVAEMVLKTPPEASGYMKSLTVQALPLLHQTVQMYQYFITQQVSGYRVVCKMSSVLFNIFIELASKGFCVPPEFSDELQGEGEGRPSDGLGLGEGEGKKDVSDRIESEDQLDDARPAGEEKEKEEEKGCEEEEKGIEMSEDFEGKVQDKAKKDDENEESSDSDDSDADEQMGETEKGADRLDQEIWGSDTEEPEEGEDKEDKGDGGEKQGEDQLGPKEDQQNEDNKDDEKGEELSSEKNKKEINEMEEPEYDEDQIDPHHGNQPELPEPEPMELPDDLQLDDGVEKEDQEMQEENPFDIDKMKENVEEQTTPDEENPPDDNKDEGDEAKDFSSDDEDIKRGGEEGDDDKDIEDASKEVEENAMEDKKEESVAEDQKDEDEEEKGDESSGLDQNQSHQENVQAMDVEDITATDITEDNSSTRKSNQEPIDELNQEDNRDEEGVGQSQMEESKSGHTAQSSSDQELKGSKQETEEDEREEKKKRKPGESDSQRSLGDINEPVKKKLKTKDARQESADNNEDKEEQQAEMYQHIKDAKETRTQVLDVATEEQVEEQRKEVPNKEDEEAEAAAQNQEELPMEEEREEEPEVAESEKVESEKVEGANKKKNNKKEQHKDGDILDEPQEIHIDGDTIDTLTAPRDSLTTHHTSNPTIDPTPTRLTTIETDNLRSEVERQLSTWHEPPSNLEAEQTWQKISSVTASLARDLSEQLRLVLEPTKASRLKGDFRTGKRINMRKVIPYIASEFRKDKIWLRRTKPSKREYQIVIAIDDSSSMSDNRSKELAFESVSLISKALTLLESGELSVLSFGERVQVIHKLSEQFTDNSGVKLLRTFNFDQNKTCVAKLLDFATEMLDQSVNHQSLNSKLLVIVSDGRGVFSEGETYVRQAVRRARLADVFVVFVIIDNPENKSSILDIRMPMFKDGKLSSIQSYMDAFPFSFYIILRDIGSLPSVLSDALRQWFEIVSNLSK